MSKKRQNSIVYPFETQRILSLFNRYVTDEEIFNVIRPDDALTPDGIHKYILNNMYKKFSLSPSEIKRICDCFGVSADYILCRIDTKTYEIKTASETTGLTAAAVEELNMCTRIPNCDVTLVLSDLITCPSFTHGFLNNIIPYSRNSLGLEQKKATLSKCAEYAQKGNEKMLLNTLSQWELDTFPELFSAVSESEERKRKAHDRIEKDIESIVGILKQRLFNNALEIQNKQKEK